MRDEERGNVHDRVGGKDKHGWKKGGRAVKRGPSDGMREGGIGSQTKRVCVVGN